MIIHMAYNIGPRKSLNDDIDEIEEEKGSDEEQDMEGDEMEADFEEGMEEGELDRDEANASPEFFEINNVTVEDDQKKKAEAMK